MARKHMMQRWTSSVGVTTREFHSGFLWQRQSHQVCGCWHGMHSRQSNTFHSITAHWQKAAHKDERIVKYSCCACAVQVLYVDQHCSNPGCPASSDVGNAISTKTKTKSRLREIWSWNPPKMIQSCQRICSYTTLSKIHGFWRTEQSWTLLRTHLCLLTLVALQSDVA